MKCCGTPGDPICGQVEEYLIYLAEDTLGLQRLETGMNRMITDSQHMEVSNGFHKWGIPNSWMVYKGKSRLEMDDEWGYTR